jgi:hypothetical protein
VVRKDGEGVQELLHEHPPFPVGGLRPDLVHVQLAKDGEHLVEAAGDLRSTSRFLSVDSPPAMGTRILVEIPSDG